MLYFDSRGNLTPYIPIQSTLSELKDYFVDKIQSKSRSENFDKYIKYSNDLKDLLGGITLQQWINGSFVTKKNNPKDIDLVTFLDHDVINKMNHKLDPFKPNGSWDVYNVDAYIIEVYPMESKLYNNYTMSDLNEWLDLYSHTRLNRNGQRFNKGFIEIFY